MKVPTTVFPKEGERVWGLAVVVGVKLWFMVLTLSLAIMSSKMQLWVLNDSFWYEPSCYFIQPHASSINIGVESSLSASLFVLSCQLLTTHWHDNNEVGKSPNRFGTSLLFSYLDSCPCFLPTWDNGVEIAIVSWTCFGRLLAIFDIDYVDLTSCENDKMLGSASCILIQQIKLYLSNAQDTAGISSTVKCLTN